MAVKILLVEDESIAAMDMKMALESFGYQVPYTASKGEEAVIKASKERPDLVLMDINLKGELNGIEAALEIKKLNIPFIYLTAYSDTSTMEQAKLTEPYGFIIKPYNSLELNYAIELALYKHEMETKLKESEARYRLLVESQKDFIVEADAKGRFIFVSPSFCKLLGKTSAEIIGKTLLDFVDEKDHEKTVESFRSSFSRPPFNGYREVRLNAKDGWRWVSWSGQPVLDENQKVLKIIAVGRDFSERKKAEEKLKATNKALKKRDETFKHFINAAPLSIALFDNKMNYIAASKRWIQEYGLHDQELYGKCHYDVFPDLPEEYKKIHKKALNGSVLKDDNTKFVHDDGSIQYFKWEVQPWYSSSGKIGGITIFNEPLTKRLKPQ